MRATEKLAHRPMVMQPAGVHAILHRLKTQTRRVIEPQPTVPSHIRVIDAHDFDKPGECGFYDEDRDYVCRYGPPGRILWLKEKWRALRAKTSEELADGAKPSLMIAYGDAPLVGWWKPCDEKTMLRYAHDGRWQNPRFMPAWACRSSVEVTQVKAQRLGDMALREIFDEGIKPSYGEQMMAFGEHLGNELLAGRENHLWDNKPTMENWIWYWNLINQERGHPYDPGLLVWAITFKPLVWTSP